MRRLAKLIFAMLLFLVMLMLFLPKENLYYAAEEALEKEGVIIDGETLQNTFTSLQLNGATLMFKGIRTLQADKVVMTTLGVWNRIELNDAEIDKTFAAFVPTHIDHVMVTYSVLSPRTVVFELHGEAGSLTGSADLGDRTVEARVHPSTAMQRQHASLLKSMQKDTETGGYRYETSF